VGARVGQTQRAVEIASGVDLDDGKAQVLFVLWTHSTVVWASQILCCGKGERELTGLSVAGNILKERGVSEQEGFERAVVRAELAQVHSLVAIEDLGSDHRSANRA